MLYFVYKVVLHLNVEYTTLRMNVKHCLSVIKNGVNDMGKIELLEVCPKCGSDQYDTVKWSVFQGVEPHDDYHECCSCGNVFDEPKEEAK